MRPVVYRIYQTKRGPTQLRKNKEVGSVLTISPLLDFKLFFKTFSMLSHIDIQRFEIS